MSNQMTNRDIEMARASLVEIGKALDSGEFAAPESTEWKLRAWKALNLLGIALRLEHVGATLAARADPMGLVLGPDLYAMHSWLERETIKLGTPDQIARFEKRLLPDVELVDLARTELFKPFAQFSKWQPLKYGDVHHVTDTCRGWVDITSRHLYPVSPISPGREDYLSQEQWDTCQRINRVAETMATEHPWLAKPGVRPTIRLQEHVAVCPMCKVEVRKLSALVTIQWAGRNLSREYAL
jgi:hypothetical protein